MICLLRKESRKGRGRMKGRKGGREKEKSAGVWSLKGQARRAYEIDMKIEISPLEYQLHYLLQFPKPFEKYCSTVPSFLHSSLNISADMCFWAPGYSESLASCEGCVHRGLNRLLTQVITADSASGSGWQSTSAWSHLLKTLGPWEDMSGEGWAVQRWWPSWAYPGLGKQRALAVHAGWSCWCLVHSSASRCFARGDYWLRWQGRLGRPCWGNTVSFLHSSWAPGAVLWLDSKPLSVQSVLHTLCALFPGEKCSEKRRGKSTPGFKQFM